MLRRYTNMKVSGDRYAEWTWIQKAIDLKWEGPRKGDKKTPA